MGDRNNPIKFGPEWLRNFAPERNAGGTVSSSSNTNSGIPTSSASTASTQPSVVYTRAASLSVFPGTLGSTVTSGTVSQGAAACLNTNTSTSQIANSRNLTNNAPKVLLAKQRYGREEMLALYDRTVEAPEELKRFEFLYKPRGKSPVALNSTFEEMQRANTRGGPSVGAVSQGERFSGGRGTGRGGATENRGRSRMPFVRQSARSAWHMGNTRPPVYNTAPEQDANPLRPWGANNGITPLPARSNTEQQEWNPNRVFRRRQVYNTNWRQPQTRDEGDKWRSSDAARGRSNIDKWNRDWGERLGQDRPQAWNSNRRTWVGGERHNDDNLPEWAMDNAIGGSGTFDSSGAFHGYSNDDTNLPKTQDTSFSLVRSQTHGSFVRSKTDEEPSEDWWASDKAKKLSEKKFDASDIKFKKPSTSGASEANVSGSNTEETKQEETVNHEKSEEYLADPLDKPENAEETLDNINQSDEKDDNLKPKFTESKTFDALMRSDIDIEKVTDDRGNFQSVMITQNNSLRQKHQNIVASGSENAPRQGQGRIPVLQMLHGTQSNENDCRQTPEKLAEDMFDMTLEDSKNATSKGSVNDSNISGSQSDHRLFTQIPNAPPGGMSSIQSSGISNKVLTMTSTVPTSKIQGTTLTTPGMQTCGMLSVGIQSNAIHSAGIQSGGIQVGVIQAGGIQSGSLQAGALQARDLQTGLMQPSGKQAVGLQSGVMQSSGIQPGGMQSGTMQPSGMQPGGMQPGGMQPGGMQPGGMQPGGMQSSGIQPGAMQPGAMQPGAMQPGAMQPVAMQSSGMQPGGMQPGGMQPGGMQPGGMQPGGMQPGGMQPGGMQPGGMQPGGMQPGGMQPGGMQPGGMQPGGMQPGGMQPGGMQPGGMQLGGMQHCPIHSSGVLPGGMQQSIQQGGMQQVLQRNIIQQSNMQPGGMQSSSLQSTMLQTGMQGTAGLQALQAAGLQAAGMSTGIQNIGIQNAALNSSLGLSNNNGLMLSMQGVSTPVLPSSALSNAGLGSAGLQQRSSMLPNFPSSGLSMMSNQNVANSSLFLGQGTTSMQSSNDLQLQSHGTQSSLFPMHNLQLSNSQASYGSIYSNIISSSQGQSTQTAQNLADQWYYQDPENVIQGPFSSKEMHKWYRAGFFTPSLMVRRACDSHMRPLGSYGSMVPFAQIELPPFPLSSAFERRTQGSRDIINQSGLGLDDSLWSQPTASPDLMWMQQAMNARNESRVNHLPLFFWDSQPSTITSSSLMNEDLTKEMKTEDQILAQLRASQNINSQTLPFISSQNSVSTTISNKLSETYSPNVGATPNMEELQKLIQPDALSSPSANIVQPKTENKELEAKAEKLPKDEPVSNDNIGKQQQQNQNKGVNETKPAKSSKAENEKIAKNKENNTTKSKTKKSKEEKKEDVVESKSKEDALKTEQKRSVESSPSKSRKEDKQNKKELEKERKEWVKEGFTIVKGSEKSNVKDTKKKPEERKSPDEVERKRKEEEKIATDEKKEKKQNENQKKFQYDPQMHQQAESIAVARKAPWSAAATQAQAVSKDSITLAEIQRLEREKKMEQMKVQQQMMQIIAQQQAAAVAREQEMQVGFGWAKKKGSQVNAPGQSLAEIQAEARKQAAENAAAAAAAAAVATQVLEEAQLASVPITHVTWATPGSTVGGFWDTQPNANTNAKAVEKPQEPQKSGAITKINKKKFTPPVIPKKESSPAVEFEYWCNNVLAFWSTKIDVPTFVAFLKDLESPYEVKDYVKFYLGESKDANDFARQFLERRSKLLRVGMVTPSDDLCSPAIAVNPRPQSCSDYQEGKGKKTKKNKMLKVDSRILGFSVTAAEDRINVGDIDTA
ncbi:uncharacterized protein Gyf isoform X2 [Battus philenor]|uniref:uncharacterized protein Gyf isoform X2 n=1 Tax=Battus philenor TaxID=42288 RepID=UPI0035CF58E7